MRSCVFVVHHHLEEQAIIEARHQGGWVLFRLCRPCPGPSKSRSSFIFCDGEKEKEDKNDVTAAAVRKCGRQGFCFFAFGFGAWMMIPAKKRSARFHACKSQPFSVPGWLPSLKSERQKMITYQHSNYL
jgi:hypothetical protein